MHRILFILLLVACGLACNRADDPLPKIRLTYSDSLYFKVPGTALSTDPVTRPAEAGYFKAIPLGLAIDSLTGRINITESEGGIRYKIFYISDDQETVLDSAKLVVSGIDYRDSIYNLSTAGLLFATPIYNADPTAVLPCADDDDDDDDDDDPTNPDDDDDCEFDEKDTDDDGDDDLPGVNGDGCKVDVDNGVIDLAGSFADGFLGNNPTNGTTRDFEFFYRITDASNRNLQAITVRFYYFNTAADIPASLRAELGNRDAQARDVLMRNRDRYIQASLMATTGFNRSEDLMRLARDITSRPKRPPIIILVGR